MVRYLYAIDESGWYEQSYPFMPMVLAEKTAKEANKAVQRERGRRWSKYKASKTTLATKDTSPRGLKMWYRGWNA